MEGQPFSNSVINIRRAREFVFQDMADYNLSLIFEICLRIGRFYKLGFDKNYDYNFVVPVEIIGEVQNISNLFHAIISLECGVFLFHFNTFNVDHRFTIYLRQTNRQIAEKLGNHDEDVCDTEIDK